MLLAIVQARLSSKRLPNKVLLKVCGKPLIEYLFDRLKKVRKIDKIILATSNSPKDDELIKFSNNLNIETFRGSEKDVLERFYKAAKYFKADKILRITGDCPLISPKIINKLIKYFSMINIDYAYTSERFAEGLDCEIFTYNALKKTYLSAKKQSEREHITQYIKNNPKLLAFAENIARQQYDEIGLGVGLNEDYGPAQSLYVKQGYVPNKKSKAAASRFVVLAASASTTAHHGVPTTQKQVSK